MFGAYQPHRWLALAALAATISLTMGEPGASASIPPVKTGVVLIAANGLPRQDIAAVKTDLANSIRALVKPGEMGATIYFRAVTDHAYATGALQTIVVPPVIAPPSASMCPDPFNVPCKQRYQHLKAEAAAQLKSATASVERQLARLMNADIPQGRSPDFLGAAYKARDLFPPRGQRYLVIVGDMPSISDHIGTLRLHQVDADIIDDCQEDTTTCLVRRAQWNRALKRADVIDTRFWDPSQNIELFGVS